MHRMTGSKCRSAGLRSDAGPALSQVGDPDGTEPDV